MFLSNLFILFLLIASNNHCIKSNEARDDLQRIITLQKDPEKCLSERRTKQGDRIEIEYTIFTKKKKQIGKGNFTLEIGTESELNYGAELLSRGNILSGMCVGGVKRIKFPVAIIWENGYNFISQETQYELDYMTDKDILIFEVKLLEINEKEILVEKDDDEETHFRSVIDNLWKIHDGRKINKIKTENCAGRKTKDGDTIQIDYVAVVIETDETIENIKEFVVNIGDNLSNLFRTEFFSCGEVLTDMCVGDEREIHVPMEIASHFGYDKLGIEPSSTLKFTVKLRKIFEDDEIVKFRDEL